MPTLSALHEPVRLPALEALHPLILSLCQNTRGLPPGDGADLALRLRRAALAAAEALLPVAAGSGTEAVSTAARHLREASFHLDIARRLGHLSLGTAAEILEHLALASLEVALLQRTSETSAPLQPPLEVRRVPPRPRRFRLIAALRREAAHG